MPVPATKVSVSASPPAVTLPEAAVWPAHVYPVSPAIETFAKALPLVAVQPPLALDANVRTPLPLMSFVNVIVILSPAAKNKPEPSPRLI